MTKKFLTLGILGIVMVGIVTPNISSGQTLTQLEQQCVARGGTWHRGTENSQAECLERGGPKLPGTNEASTAKNLIEAGIFYTFAPLIKGISTVITGLSAGFLWLSGTLFDKIVEYSILDMAKNLGGKEGTIGESISQAWAALRDIANMFFIFVLLFVAFKAMFSLSFGDVGKNVLNIIIVALLINFSLFFSKIVIDASNIVAIGFYNSITNARVSSEAGEGSTVGNSGGQSTITTGYMRLLGLNGLYDSKTLLQSPGDASQMLIHGVMSSIFLLITAVIFLIAAVMFAARFVILIFLMILSPLALIALIIPGQSAKFNTWKNALIDQSFFAPVFFAMTWVVFKVATGLKIGTSLLSANSATLAAGLKTPSPDGMQLILNYVIIIGLSIAALIFSKQMATKTAGFANITGGITAGVAFAGRQTIGRGSKWIGENARESWSKSSLGRAGLWAANKGAAGSFDIKGIGESKAIKAVGGGELFKGLGSATGKGGFNKAVEEKAKAKAAYAKAVYGQTDDEKEAHEKAKKAEEEDVIVEEVDADGNKVKRVVRKGIKTRRAETAARTKAEADAAESAAKTHMNNKLQETRTNYEAIKREKIEAERRGASKEEIKAIVDRMTNERTIMDEIRKDTEENDETYKKLKNTANETRTAAQEAEKQRRKKDIDEEEYSAKTQAMGKVGQKRQEDYAERLRKGSPVSTGGGALIGGAIGGLATPLGAVVGAAVGGAIGNVLGSKLPDELNWAGNKAAAREVAKQAKGKSKAEKLADAAKDYQEEQDKKAGEGGAGSPANTTPPGTPPSPPDNP